MAKTRRIIKANLQKVDAVIEVLDARIPCSSRNPEMDLLLKGKPRFVALNKSDIADENITKKWENYLKNKNLKAISLDSRSGKGLQKIKPAAEEVLREELARRAKRGMSGMAIRLMVVGIPNVGKSSLINRLCGSRCAKVEDRPGVTRGTQWVNAGGNLEILDTPGILWPKFEDPHCAERLAFTGAIKDDILDIEALAARMLEYLNVNYNKILEERYSLKETSSLEPAELLELFAVKRGMVQKGGLPDTLRAAIHIIDEFRAGKTGRISLESPEDFLAEGRQ
jgi:ribosome biogenesis GTPase A